MVKQITRDQNFRASIAKSLMRILLLSSTISRLDAGRALHIFGDSHRRISSVTLPSLPLVCRRASGRLITSANRRWIPGPTSDKLNTCRQGSDFRRKQERIFMPKRTFQPNRRHRVEDARLSLPHEDQERSRRAEPSPRRRPQACLRQRRIPRLSLPAVLFRPEQVPEPTILRPNSLRQCHEHFHQA